MSADNQERIEGAACCSEPKLDELKAALAGGERLLILTHDNPDPDALASAFALFKLIETIDGASTSTAPPGGIPSLAQPATITPKERAYINVRLHLIGRSASRACFVFISFYPFVNMCLTYAYLLGGTVRLDFTEYEGLSY